MPAQTVAGAPAPTVTSTPTAPGESRDAGITAGHFGRQLDAARRDQGPPRKDVNPDSGDRAEAKHDAAEQPGTAALAGAAAEAVVLAPGVADAVKSGLGGAGAVAGNITDEADHVPTDSVPQGVFAMLAPLLGGASAALVAAGGMGGGRRTVVPALASSSAAGVAADAARAAALLQLPAAATQPANVTPAGGVGNSIGLAAVLDAVQLHVADDTQTSAASSPAGIGTASLPLVDAGARVPVVFVATPVGTPAFGQEFGRQITWLATQDLKQAHVRLHPEELGQVDLKINVTDGRVDVAFSVQHPGAAQAVQQSLPQLDQMLAQQGLSLGHTEVGQHGSDGSSSSHRHGVSAVEVEDGGELHAVTSLTAARPSSLLDAFA